MYKAENAVIMAAGVSSRFAPLSYEKPKALTEVRGEILIERQIRQLRSAGITEIFVVVGYKAEQFEYLCEKHNVHLIMNKEYMVRNNHSSIYAAKEVIGNSYICSADNYFLENPFEKWVEDSYYAAVFASDETNEWCIQVDKEDYIKQVEVGGRNSWYMLGHTFWSEPFSKKFLCFLEREYDSPQTKTLFWENILINHLDELRMKMRKYPENMIFEFDSIEDLRKFDRSYIADTRSSIVKEIAQKIGGTEADILDIEAIKKDDTTVAGFSFWFRKEQYSFSYCDWLIRRNIR